MVLFISPFPTFSRLQNGLRYRTGDITPPRCRASWSTARGVATSARSRRGYVAGARGRHVNRRFRSHGAESSARGIS